MDKSRKPIFLDNDRQRLFYQDFVRHLSIVNFLMLLDLYQETKGLNAEEYKSKLVKAWTSAQLTVNNMIIEKEFKNNPTLDVEELQSQLNKDLTNVKKTIEFQLTVPHE